MGEDHQRRIRPFARGVTVQGRLRLGETWAARPDPNDCVGGGTARGDRQSRVARGRRTPLVTGQIADLARNMGISEEEVVETVLLQPTTVKRPIEPSEVARYV